MRSLRARVRRAFALTVVFLALGLAPAHGDTTPDLGAFDAPTRQSLELACITSKSDGPAVYARCLNRQIDALRSAPRIPSLSRFDSVTRQSLELACVTSKHQGPASYANCLNEQLDALSTSPGIPSLSGIDSRTRQSIELACITPRSQGPAAYAKCLRSHLDATAGGPADATPPRSPDPALAPPQAPPSPPAPSAAPPAIAVPEVPREPTGPSHPPEAWAGVKKPSMPSKLRTGSSSPDVVFSSVEQSVYVLISAPSVQALRARSNVSQGSAVAITPRIALTNCHVLKANPLYFLVKNRKVFGLTIAYGHVDSDRCAVAVKSGSLTPIAGVRPYSTLVVGERVYSVGSPSGLENTLGEGIVSGLRRRAGIELVQTTAPISPGSSGGGLFDAAGNLIGITTFLLRGSQNLNFAIAADTYWK